MTQALQDKLAALTFKRTELTAIECIVAQKLQREQDVASLLQFIALRVDGNQDFEKLNPVELYELTLSELRELALRRVIGGILDWQANGVIGQSVAVLGIH